MDTRELKEILLEESNRIKQLADKVSESGEPLDALMKRDIRTVLAGQWLKRCQDEARWFFEEGNTQDFKTSHKHLLNTLEELV